MGTRTRKEKMEAIELIIAIIPTIRIIESPVGLSINNKLNSSIMF